MQITFSVVGSIGETINTCLSIALTLTFPVFYVTPLARERPDFSLKASASIGAFTLLPRGTPVESVLKTWNL
jgi:hypothetical protein